MVSYEQPVRTIRGKVAALSHIVPASWVDVYDNAASVPRRLNVFRRKKKKANQIASVEPNAKGEFNIKHLRKGFYEVEFGNQGMGGYNILSVLVNVDPKGRRQALRELESRKRWRTEQCR